MEANAGNYPLDFTLPWDSTSDGFLQYAEVYKDCIEDLIISKRLSKNPKHYKQHVNQVIAAEQLIKEGSEVHAGNSVHFVFTDSNNKRFERRVKAEQLLDKGVNPDERKYLQLLYESAANLLSFSKYTAKAVQDSIKRYENKTLETYLSK
jgi:DNA polymerase elongation subunit (family B)